jgi:hypothetical protein
VALMHEAYADARAAAFRGMKLLGEGVVVVRGRA